MAAVTAVDLFPQVCILSRMVARPHRIAVVSRNFGDVGGAEHFAARLAEGVADDPRYEVHVFTSRRSRCHPRIRLHLLPQPIGPRLVQKPLFAWLAQRALSREEPFDLIHTHEPLVGAHIVTYGTPHSFWAREVRNKSWLGPTDRLTIWLEKQMLHHPNCRIILPMSQMVRETLSTHYPLLENKLFILEPGIEEHQLTTEEQHKLRSVKRSELNVAEDEMVALFIGNNYQHKGLSQILDAMSQLPQPARKELKLWVLGRGDIAHYQKLCASLGLKDRVHFMGLVRDNVAQWMYAADFLVLLSSFETFGMVVLESLATGLPTIISDRVGSKDLISHGKNGWVIPHDASPEIVGKTLLEAKRFARNRAVKTSAREAASQHTWRIAQNRVIEIYDEYLKNNSWLASTTSL